MVNSIRYAAYQLIVQELDKLSLPSSFQMLYDNDNYTVIRIRGPYLHKDDDHTINGIRVRICSSKNGYILLSPVITKNVVVNQDELWFDIADPQFPQIVYDTVNYWLVLWLNHLDLLP